MTETATKKKFFGVEYDPQVHELTAFTVDEPYEAPKDPLVIKDPFSYLQPWSGYVNESPLPPADAARVPAQTSNLKTSMRYQGVEVIGNKWMKLACSEALKSVQTGGGPFATIIVQIENDSNRAIRYWSAWNRVSEWVDPTAHGEVTAIRQACQELGVINLGEIRKDDPNLKLPQKGETTRCELYTSAEPCPMCYAATRWSRINKIYFAATIYDAANQGVSFSDEPIYAELANHYIDRQKMGVWCYQCTTDNSLDAFNHYKRSGMVKY